MTIDRESIIKWTREAGFNVDEQSRKYQPDFIFWCGYSCQKELSEFAALVAAAAVASEREACAKVCDVIDDGHGAVAAGCANAIRARGLTT